MVMEEEEEEANFRPQGRDPFSCIQHEIQARYRERASEKGKSAPEAFSRSFGFFGICFAQQETRR